MSHARLPAAAFTDEPLNHRPPLSRTARPALHWPAQRSRPPLWLHVVTAMTAAAAPSVQAHRVQLDVVVTVVDHHNRPLPATPVRLVLGRDPGWQAPTAGTWLLTGADGRSHLSTTLDLQTRHSSRPLGFTGLSLPARSHHVAVAVEMPYMHQAWLYSADVDRFASDRVSQVKDTAMLARDATGQFTVPVHSDPQQGVSPPELNGLWLSRSPYQAQGALLAPVSDTDDNSHWILQLRWQKSADAVRR